VTQLHDLAALGQAAAAFRRGEVSPVVLAEHYRARIAGWTPPSARASIIAERARYEASAAGEREGRNWC